LSRGQTRIPTGKRIDVDIEIVVDRREPASQLPGWLARQEGVFLAWSMLRSADDSIQGVIGIERRTAVDLAKSVRKAASAWTSPAPDAS
jgi:ERCC4-type nuclease